MHHACVPSALVSDAEGLGRKASLGSSRGTLSHINSQASKETHRSLEAQALCTLRIITQTLPLEMKLLCVAGTGNGFGLAVYKPHCTSDPELEIANK